MTTGIKANGNYATLKHLNDVHRFFLFCVLLHEDAMFLHTQKRTFQVHGPTKQLVHCPVRVGGKGSVHCAFCHVSIIPFFQYPSVSCAIPTD